jgi:hypothetical protein
VKRSYGLLTGYPPAEFIEEVQQEDHFVILPCSDLSFRCDNRDALTVWRHIPLLSRKLRQPYARFFATNASPLAVYATAIIWSPDRYKMSWPFGDHTGRPPHKEPRQVDTRLLEICQRPPVSGKART